MFDMNLNTPLILELKPVTASNFENVRISNELVNIKLRKIEAVLRRCSVKKVFLKISQNLQENILPESLF